MANLYGVERTKANKATGQYLLTPGVFGGNVRVMHDTYSMASMTGTSDVLYLGGNLPPGAKILLIVLKVTANQTSLTFKLGTVYNDHEFVSAGSTDLATSGIYHYGGNGYVVGTAANDDQIILTNAAAAGSAATLYCDIYYTND
jgi:hypothetical protein